MTFLQWVRSTAPDVDSAVMLIKLVGARSSDDIGKWFTGLIRDDAGIAAIREWIISAKDKQSIPNVEAMNKLADYACETFFPKIGETND